MSAAAGHTPRCPQLVAPRSNTRAWSSNSSPEGNRARGRGGGAGCVWGRGWEGLKGVRTRHTPLIRGA
jgi:hypothetical protein